MADHRGTPSLPSMRGVSTYTRHALAGVEPGIHLKIPGFGDLGLQMGELAHFPCCTMLVLFMCQVLNGIAIQGKSITYYQIEIAL